MDPKTDPKDLICFYHMFNVQAHATQQFNLPERVDLCVMSVICDVVQVTDTEQPSDDMCVMCPAIKVSRQGHSFFVFLFLIDNW